MKLVELKEKLGIEKFKWSPSTNKDETINEKWYRMWDNEKRVNYTIHVDTFKIIKENEILCAKNTNIAPLDNLSYQEEHKTPTDLNNGVVAKPYTNIRIIVFNENVVGEM